MDICLLMCGDAEEDIGIQFIMWFQPVVFSRCIIKVSLSVDHGEDLSVQHLQ